MHCAKCHALKLKFEMGKGEYGLGIRKSNRGTGDIAQESSVYLTCMGPGFDPQYCKNHKTKQEK
jgi:hypothetical protein